MLALGLCVRGSRRRFRDLAGPVVDPVVVLRSAGVGEVRWATASSAGQR